MAALSTIIAGIGVAGGLAGTFIQYSGQKKAEEAQQRMADLEARRQTREQYRQAQIARAQALSAGVAGNAQTSSSVQGGMGSASSQAAYNVQGIQNSREIGRQISAGNQMANMGAMVSSLGGAVVNMSGTLGRIGEYVAGQQDPWYNMRYAR